MENYPGGTALEHLKNHFEATSEMSGHHATKWQDVHVHIDVAAAMTGVSLFGQRSVTDLYPIQMSKSGYEAENDTNDPSRSYTHLLSEEQSVRGYHIVDTIDGFPRLDKRNLRIITNPAIHIFERDGWTAKEYVTRRAKRVMELYYIFIVLSGFIVAATLGLHQFFRQTKTHMS